MFRINTQTSSLFSDKTGLLGSDASFSDYSLASTEDIDSKICTRVPATACLSSTADAVAASLLLDDLLENLTRYL